MSDKKNLTEFIKNRAKGCGFHLVAITPATPSDHFIYYQEWIKRGGHGEMSYLERHTEKKGDPRGLLPFAKSMICLGLSYKTVSENPREVNPDHGLISNYAWGDDYHDVITHKLKALWKMIQAKIPDVEGRYYVDTGPVLERSYAERAGLGWIGKNTCLINREYGSYVFLSEMIINYELEYDTPETDHCGTCTACLDACPTNALEPYRMNAIECISYLTIEKRSELTDDEKEKISPYIFGCDICQQVCPWNDKAKTPNLLFFQSRSENYIPKLYPLSQLTEETFSTRFRKSPVKRAKRSGLIRNVEALKETQQL